MAVAPTGAIYKALKFDNVSSRTYGVYITGEAVYNAPARDVEMITIPGRNGSFALDNGRFENIEVSYPAGIFADTEADFRQAIADFRNFLCSRKGYVRLQDEYNPDEYRMAVYKSGLEVDPAMLKAGEFTITFDCKPQRYLTSGETKQTIASSGDTITNPTLFESSPLLEVEGYGDIVLNGQTVSISNTEIGDIVVTSGNDSVTTSLLLTTLTVDIAEGNYQNGDLIHTVGGEKFFRASFNTKMVSPAVYGTTGMSGAGFTPTSPVTIGTPYTETFTYTLMEMTAVDANYNPLGKYTTDITFTLSYDGVKTITITALAAFSGTGAQYVDVGSSTIQLKQLAVYSTVRTVSDIIEIDLDLGEAWIDVAGVITPVNNIVSLGTKLPTLSSGSNVITFDNTINTLNVTPRWWKI